MSVINVCSINLEMMWSRGTSSPLKRRWCWRSGPKDLVCTTTRRPTSSAAPTAAGPSPGLGYWSIWWNIAGLHRSPVMSTRSGLSILPSWRSWETLTSSPTSCWSSEAGSRTHHQYIWWCFTFGKLHLGLNCLKTCYINVMYCVFELDLLWTACYLWW